MDGQAWTAITWPPAALPQLPSSDPPAERLKVAVAATTTERGNSQEPCLGVQVRHGGVLASGSDECSRTACAAHRGSGYDHPLSTLIPASLGNLIIGIFAYLPVAATVPLALFLLARTGQSPRTLRLGMPSLRRDIYQVGACRRVVRHRDRRSDSACAATRKSLVAGEQNAHRTRARLLRDLGAVHLVNDCSRRRGACQWIPNHKTGSARLDT